MASNDITDVDMSFITSPLVYRLKRDIQR